MKLKDYKLDTAEESVILTYDQACKYYEETLKMIEESKFDLFDDEEELTLPEAREKYNEINRRLQSLGQAFEIFMKYIINASRMEKDPTIDVNELWNKWIRGHQMVTLINDKANSPEVLPNFKEIFNLAMNSCYGIYGFNYIYHLGAEAAQGRIEPIKLFSVLMPQNYQGDGALTDDEIEKIIDKNTAIYEKCRYNMQAMTNYDFGEVFYFLNFVRFFAKMVHISNSKTQIDYNVAYVHAMADDDIIKQLLTSLRPENEVEEILNDEFFNKDAKLLSYLLTINQRPLEEIRRMIQMDQELENPNNLYVLLSYNIPIESITKCHEKGLNVMLLASNFSLEEIEKIISIPGVGEYLNNNSVLMNRMITHYVSDIGLTFEDWYEILNSEVIKQHPEYLANIITRYKEVYATIFKNDRCNSIFALPGDVNREPMSRYHFRKPFSEYFREELLSNISNNSQLGMTTDVTDNIPLSIDSENVKRVFNIMFENGICYFSPSILEYPANEVYAVIQHMKKKGYDLASERFQNDFWSEYDSNAQYDMLLKDWYLPDEFLEGNGLKRISDRRYCEPRMGSFIRANYDNPLPNLK